MHRLLRQLGEERGRGVGRNDPISADVSFVWLRDFYISRVEEFFDGDQKYGRADDFMEELLLTSPSVVYTRDKKMGLADPLGLAEKIIEIRKDVVEEWKVLMKCVPEDHTGLRKVLLAKQMEAWGSKDGLFSEGFE